MEDTRTGAPPAGASIDELINNAAANYNLDPRIFRAMLMAENGPNLNQMTGPGGEVGFGQFMPGTAAALGINRNDPRSAIPGAAMYLRQNLNRFGNDYDQALAAYNWGPGNVASKGLAGAPASVRAYIAKIRGMPGVPAPPSGGGGAMGAQGAPGTGAPLGAPQQTSPLAQAVTPQTPQGAPMMLAGLGGGNTLADVLGTAAQQWQQQQARNVGFA